MTPVRIDPALEPAVYQARAERLVADLKVSAYLQDLGWVQELAQVSERMLWVEQAPGLSVLAHGLQVADAYLIVRGIAQGGPVPPGWRVPWWVASSDLLARQLPLGDVHPALVWHDCGKPAVRELDVAGRVHFPGHAAASAQIARRIWATRPVIAGLLEGDMLAHLALDDEAAAAFAARPDAPTLLFGAVAEVHANAQIFGGLGADSFKIKARRVDQRGRDYLRRRAAP